MNKIRNLTVLLAALLVAACAQMGDEAVEVVDADGDEVLVVHPERVADGRNLLLSELTDSLEIIHLEAREGAFFDLNRIYLSENLLAVQATNGVVRLFHRSGRYIGQLEQTQKDLYYHVYNAVIDEPNQTIYILYTCGRYIHVFDFDGRCTGRIPLRGDCNKGKLMVLADGSVALAHLNFLERQSGYNAACVSADTVRYASRLSLNVHLANKTNTFTVGFNNFLESSRSTPSLSFLPCFEYDYQNNNDTLFRYVAEENRIAPVLTVEIPDSVRQSNWLSVLELPRHYLVEIQGTKYQNIVVDKQTRAARNAMVVCDTFGDWQVPMQFCDGYAYAVFTASELHKSIRQYLNSTRSNDSNRLALQSLCNSVKATDNSVVLRWKLK